MLKEAYARGAAEYVRRLVAKYGPHTLGGAGLGGIGGGVYSAVSEDRDNLWRNVGIGAAGGGVLGTGAKRFEKFFEVPGLPAEQEAKRILQAEAAKQKANAKNLAKAIRNAAA